MRSAAADEIADRVPFLPGTGSAMLDETLELTADRAADAARTRCWSSPRTTPGPPRRACSLWYDTVAREFPDLPVIAYNVPSRTAVDIAPETVARLRQSARQHRRRQGDHQGLRALLARAARGRAGHAGLVRHRAALPAAARPSAGSGSSPPPPTSRPRPSPRCTSLWQAGESRQARDLHYALHPVTDVIFTETNPAAAKWVLAQAGLIGSGYVRPPLVPLDRGRARRQGAALLAAGPPCLTVRRQCGAGTRSTSRSG